MAHNPHLQSYPRLPRGKTVAASAAMGVLATFIAMLTGFIPLVAGLSFSIIGQMALGVGAAFSAIGMWFARASDQSSEHALWGAVSIFALVLVGVTITEAWDEMAGWIKVTLFVIILGALSYYLAQRNAPGQF